MSDFKVKMHQIRFPLGLRPTPRWGSAQIPMVEPTALPQGPTSKGRRRKGDGRGRRGKGEGREGSWREGLAHPRIWRGSPYAVRRISRPLSPLGPSWLGVVQ